MTLEQAKEIMKQARNCFGRKTVNKVYALDSHELALGDGDVEDLMEGNSIEALFADDQDRQRQLSKALARNATFFESDVQNLRGNNPMTGSRISRGDAMFHKPYLNQVGNCGEMSEVAAYLVSEKHPTLSTSIYIATIKSPGDHEFCVAGLKGPAAKSVDAMAADSANENAIVLDPWLNFACLYKDYALTASNKVGAWGIAGKRIWWTGSNGDGWYSPTGEYSTAFLTAPLALASAN